MAKLKQKTIELISFDKNHNLQYADHCKLQLNFLSKLLIIIPVNEDVKMISAFFRWKYVISQNILFAIGENEFQDFALVFHCKKRCKKVYDFICEDKINDNNNTNDESDQIGTICKQFLKPLFHQIQLTSTRTLRIRKIICQWIKKQENEVKQKLINLMKENDVYDLIFKGINNGTRSLALGLTNNSRKRSYIKMCNRRKSYILLPKLLLPAKNKLLSNPENQRILDDSCFKLVNRKHKTLVRRRLLIFTSAENCHEYLWNPQENIYYCHACKNIALFEQNDNGTFCVKISKDIHGCDTIPFAPEKYIEIKILQKPSYEIVENPFDRTRKLLIVFDPADKSYCYEYRWTANLKRFFCRGCLDNKIMARMFNENTSNEYIELLNDSHKCVKRKYQPQKCSTFNDFVLSPNFEIRKKIVAKNERKYLILKSAEEKCYIYYYCNSSNKFICSKCKNQHRNVFAHLHKNDDGEDYIILSKNQHLCTPINYAADDQKEIILRPPQIEFMKATKTGNSRLFVFDRVNKKLCYTFARASGTNRKDKYWCLACRRLSTKKEKSGKFSVNNGVEMCGIVTGFIFFEEDEGQYYFKTMNEKHICKPEKYQPEKYKLKFIKGSTNEAAAKKKHQKNQKIDESKIVKASEFSFKPNRFGVPDGKLVIFDKNDKNLCHEYYHSKAEKFYVCCKCSKIGSKVTATVKNDKDGQQFLILGNKEHICEPSKYQENDPKVIKTPNFIVLNRDDMRKLMKLIIFTSASKDLCYEYTYKQHTKHFKCTSCFSKKQHYVTAKLCKTEDGEEYVQQLKNEHICEPKKYQPEKFESQKFSTFEIYSNRFGKPNARLVVFNPDNMDFVYEFFLVEGERFVCTFCKTQKKTTTAYLRKNENGEKYVEMDALVKHVCDPIKYDPCKYKK